MEYNGVIYKYTSPSMKVYIGQTLHEKERRAQFLRYQDNYAGPKFDNARKKYGSVREIAEIYGYSLEQIRKYIRRKNLFKGYKLVYINETKQL